MENENKRNIQKIKIFFNLIFFTMTTPTKEDETISLSKAEYDQFRTDISEMKKNMKTLSEKNELSEINRILFNPSSSPAELRKAINEATNLRVRESLSPIIETAVNNNTPFLDKLLPRAKDIFDTTHHFTAELDNASDSSYGALDTSLAGQTNTDFSLPEYSRSVRFYRRFNEVGIVEQSKKTPDGLSTMERNRTHHVNKILKELDVDSIEGDNSVNANQLDGTNVFQDTYGHADLTIDLKGASLTTAIIDDLLARMEDVGGGVATDIFTGTKDSLKIQQLLGAKNTSDGTERYRWKEFPTTQGSKDPNLVRDSQLTTGKGVKATATHASGAVQFTGAISNGDTVTVAGIVYTAAAAADPAANEFLSGAAATSMASLITIINDGIPVSGATSDKVSAAAVSTDGVDFTSLVAGSAANLYAIAETGANITANIAIFSGGVDTSIYIYNMDMIQLCQFKWAGVAGIGTFPVVDPNYIASKELITWLGCLEFNNPYALARIKNVGI